MDNGAEDVLVSDLEDELDSEAAGARLEAGATQMQKPLASPVGGTLAENSAHEGSDIRADEPSVTSVANSWTNVSSRKNPQHIYRKTLLLLFGQLLAAFIFVLGHLFFFLHLDRRLVEEVSVSQSWITATSLLLVTLVKGALTMCVGTCFVQHLWYILRGKYNSLQDIERMFNICTSLLAILDPRALLRAPLLFSMGGYLWLLNVALIYPPGALVVSMDARHLPVSLTMSVLNQTFPGNFDPLDDLNGVGGSFVSMGIPDFDIEVVNSSMARITYGNGTLWASEGPMTSYAATVLSAGEIARINPALSSLNYSYVLEFNAPQLRCTESDSNDTLYAPFSSGRPDPNSGFTTTLRSYDFWYFRAGFDHVDAFKVDTARYLGYIPQPSHNLSGYPDSTGINTTHFGIATQIHTLTCHGYSALYRVNITNYNESQNLTYRVDGYREINIPAPVFSLIDGNNTLDPNKQHDSVYLRSFIPRQSAVYKEWASRKVPEYLRAAIVLELFASALGSIEGYLGARLDLNAEPEVQCIRDGWLEETDIQTRRVDICPLETLGGPGIGEANKSTNSDEVTTQTFNRPRSAIQNSALNLRRFYSFGSVLEPSYYLNITEASLNELLANISISALTQSTFFDEVDVDFEEFHNVYHFADKVGFCVPYMLCLVIALMYAGVAVRALRKNGVPAADGGFLQIMMTTRGNTMMERLIVEQAPSSVEEIEKETLRLRVRLAEVENEKGMGTGEEESGKGVRRRLAFRTEEEFGVGRKV